MIDETLSRIEKTVASTKTVDEEKKRELLRLVSTLKGEIGSLAETHRDQAQSIADFTQVSTHEATREEKNPDLVQHGLDGLATSVERFEATHPGLVNAVNNLRQVLANIGLGEQGIPSDQGVEAPVSFCASRPSRLIAGLPIPRG